ncbi:hypothetical protein GC163_24210 [bacterium]|nr:hypothetical protein [bacterium]
MLSRLLLLFLTLTLAGCAPSPPSTAQRLIGTWSRVDPEGTFTLTFAADGRLRAQFESRAWILQLTRADFDLTGNWSVDDQTLTVDMDPDQPIPWAWELTLATDPTAATPDMLIQSLTETELVLAAPGDTDPGNHAHYRRVAD